MKHHFLISCLIGFLGLELSSGQTPAFNSGSNGSYGPLIVNGNATLQLPPDGVFHCTTININGGLTFTKNALNTPVYLLATGDVNLNGSIQVRGQESRGTAGGEGGPGGFGGGRGSDSLVASGAGGGPGGGMGGSGTFNAGFGGPGVYRIANGIAGEGSVYGNSLLIPLVGGSGSGGNSQNSSTDKGWGGCGGGGAILIASNTRVVFGDNGGGTHIDASGAYRTISNAGSGGAVRIVSPVVSGFTRVQVLGFNRQNGRFRIDAFDTTGLGYSVSQGHSAPDATGTVMVVFPNPMPKLSVSNAAGTVVAENATAPVSVILPTGTTPNQTISVRARDFGSVVPIRVRLVPESGDATTYDATIDNTVNNPATTSVPVTMPINTGVRVEVYTR